MSQKSDAPLFRQFDVDPDGAVAARLFEYVRTRTPVVRDNSRGVYRYFSKIDYVNVLHSGILNPFLWEHGLHLTYVAVICAIPFARVPVDKKTAIHVDHTLEDLAINWPMVNCGNSRTMFFTDNNSGIRDELHNGGGSFTGYDERDVEYLGEFCLNKPTLFNVKIPHKVENHTDELRWALSLRFTPDPWHLLKT